MPTSLDSSFTALSLSEGSLVDLIPHTIIFTPVIVRQRTDSDVAGLKRALVDALGIPTPDDSAAG